MAGLHGPLRLSTPRGSYAPTGLQRMHYSKKYHMSPMPYSIFFRGGYAIHGTYATGALGGRLAWLRAPVAGSRRATLSHGADRGRQHFHHRRAARLHPLRQRPSSRQDDVGELHSATVTRTLAYASPHRRHFPTGVRGWQADPYNYPSPYPYNYGGF